MSDTSDLPQTRANDDTPPKAKSRVSGRKPSAPQREWLRRGLGQPGGKLPLFDEDGRKVNPRIVKACLEHGWAEHWFSNPLKPDWLVCKLTDAGRNAVTR